MILSRKRQNINLSREKLNEIQVSVKPKLNPDLNAHVKSLKEFKIDQPSVIKS